MKVKGPSAQGANHPFKCPTVFHSETRGRCPCCRHVCTPPPPPPLPEPCFLRQGQTVASPLMVNCWGGGGAERGQSQPVGHSDRRELKRRISQDSNQFDMAGPSRTSFQLCRTMELVRKKHHWRINQRSARSISRDERRPYLS